MKLSAFTSIYRHISLEIGIKQLKPQALFSLMWTGTRLFVFLYHQAAVLLTVHN